LSRLISKNGKVFRDNAFTIQYFFGSLIRIVQNIGRTHNPGMLYNMRSLFTYLIIFISSVSCSVNSERTVKADKTESELRNVHIQMDTSFNSIAHTLPDFLELSKNSGEVMFGFLQGVNKTDSSGPYVRRIFISDTLTFELIFYPKNSRKGDVDLSLFRTKYEKEGFKDFTCFAFIYPIPDRDSVKDYHADNTHYPIEIMSYVLMDNRWAFLSKGVAQDLAGLSRYQIESMYSYR